MVHGSTVATNAILERKGVKTALITNERFEDVIEIGRQNRSRLYDLAYRKEPHIVPRGIALRGSRTRYSAPARSMKNWTSKKRKECGAIRSRQSGAESVAVCFLFSYVNPSHELGMEELSGELDIPVSLSHEISSEFREFERTSTTVINAYVSPKMKKYISFIMDNLGAGGQPARHAVQRRVAFPPKRP